MGICNSKSKSKIIVTINNKKYDFTDFINLHPGGANIILKYKNKDASEKFNKIYVHKQQWIQEALKKYLI